MNIFNKLLKNTFAKNVIMIASGTAFAQLIGIVLSPLITRIYLPVDFGILTLYVSILGIINLLGALSYESAIPIAEDDSKAINVLSLSIIILILLTGILTLVLFIFGDYFLNLINAEEINEYKYLIAIGFFLSGFYTVLTKWAIRNKNYKAIATTAYSQSIVGNGSKIFLGILHLGPFGLIFGNILGQSFGISNLLFPVLKEKKLLKKVSLSSIKWCAKRFIRFPKYSAPTLFIISLTTQIPVIFLSAFFSPSVVGYYGLALTITFLPMGLLGKSVQDVFLGEASRLGRLNPLEIKALSKTLLKKLALFGALPMVILLGIGPQLFSIVFGDNWHMAGVFSSILTIYAFSHFIFHPVSIVFSIFEEQHLLLYLNIIKIILITVLFYVSNLLALSSIVTVLLFSISMAFGEYAKYILAQYVIKKKLIIT